VTYHQLLQAVTNLEEGELTKVVLARRTNIVFQGDLDSLGLLETLQVHPLPPPHPTPPPPSTPCPAHLLHTLLHTIACFKSVYSYPHPCHQERSVHHLSDANCVTVRPRDAPRNLGASFLLEHASIPDPLPPFQQKVSCIISTLRASNQVDMARMLRGWGVPGYAGEAGKWMVL
jgi:hypothetical protein